MTKITDNNLRDWDSHRTGMRFISKVVATLLLIALGAAPLLGAIPCQVKAKSSMCCATRCSMAAMEKNSAQSRVESGTLTQCGCQASPSRPVSVPPAQREYRDAALMDNALASFVPIAMIRAQGDYTPPDPRSYRHLQSVLCVFLI